MRVDDAKRAVDAGVTAISVSNHGGNNLDGTPAAIRCRRAGRRAAVGDEIEVLLDGGIRRGSDVVKAVALGARAVMIGRAYLWGLAANGQAGVENVLDILRGGIDSALLGMRASIDRPAQPGDLLVSRRVPPHPGRRHPVAPVAARRARARSDGAHGAGDLAWPGWPARAASTLLVVPVGSTEQHGPHLPLSTDTTLAVALAHGSRGRHRRRLVLAPAAGRTAPAASTPGSPARCRSAPTRCELVLVELVRCAD